MTDYTRKDLVKCYGTERLNERDERVETIYMQTPSGLYASPERPFSTNLVLSTMEWTPCEALPPNADYLGHYAGWGK